MAKKTTKHFESAMEELEQLIYALEEGKLSLDESIKSYKKGIELAAFCTDMLQQAEQQVYILDQNKWNKMNGEEENE